MKNTLFGFWLYLMSDVVLFAGLFALYAVLQSQTYGAGQAASLFNLPFVLKETLILLTSSFTIGLALLAAHSNRRDWTIILLVLTLALGLSFLTLELSEFQTLILGGNGPNASAFLSSFFTLVGTHGLHIFVGSLWMIVMIVFVAVKGLGESTLRKLMCLSLFWHFLDIIWICIFTFVYLYGLLA